VSRQRISVLHGLALRAIGVTSQRRNNSRQEKAIVRATRGCEAVISLRAWGKRGSKARESEAAKAQVFFRLVNHGRRMLESV